MAADPLLPSVPDAADEAASEHGRTEPTLAAALLPMLLHSINNTTQLLIAVGGAPSVREPDLEGCGGDLARAAASAHDHGWILGVLGCELGADLLLARRKERGLEPLVALVRTALRRRGGDLDGPAELPRLAPDVGSGWELPWGLGWLLWCSALDDPGARVRFSVQEREAPAAAAGPGRLEGPAWRVAVTGGGGARLRAAAARVVGRLPEARLDLRVDGADWWLPAAWLRREPRPDDRQRDGG